MIKNCLYCGKEFEFEYNGGRLKKYCSNRCAERKRHGVILKDDEFNDKYLCKQCGKKFISENKKHLCSEECTKKYILCRAKELRKSENYIQPTRKIYKKICLFCGGQFETKNNNAKYCSMKCVNKYTSAFKPQNQRKNFNVYRGKEHLKDWNYKNWRKRVFERDGYKCRCCDSKGKNGSLRAHHLDGWHDNVDLRYDIDNGITLCFDCHIEFHNAYGYGKNTNKQFQEFLNERRCLCANSIETNICNYG